jgi:hypothetical protein
MNLLIALHVIRQIRYGSDIYIYICPEEKLRKKTEPLLNYVKKMCLRVRNKSFKEQTLETNLQKLFTYKIN